MYNLYTKELRRIYADLMFLFKQLHRTVSCNLLDHINLATGICMHCYQRP